MEVIDNDDDDDYNESDDGDDNDDDNDDGQDQPKKKYIKKAPGKPVPLHLQNLKRSYCECGRSYSHGSDLKRHKLEECGENKKETMGLSNLSNKVHEAIQTPVKQPKR